MGLDAVYTAIKVQGMSLVPFGNKSPQPATLTPGKHGLLSL